MRPLRRPTTTIHYHGIAYLDEGAHALTFSINGVRWEYTLPANRADACLHILKVASTAKAMAYAKKHSGMARCLDCDLRQAILLRHRGGIASRAKRLKVTFPERA